MNMLKWTRAPLIALAIISIGPSVITPILYLVLRIVDVKNLDHSRIVFNEGTVAFILVLPVIFALANWPFLALHAVCRRKARKEWPSVRSVRLAMWLSLIAMCLPNIPMLIVTPQEAISDARDVGQGIGFGIALFILLPVPVLGLVGWLAGRFMARATKPAEGMQEPMR